VALAWYFWNTGNGELSKFSVYLNASKHTLKGECNMEIIEVKCENCSKEIYINREQVREKMFCTLGCMDSYKSPSSTKRLY
jgi:hypothetical protein